MQKQRPVDFEPEKQNMRTMGMLVVRHAQPTESKSAEADSQHKPYGKLLKDQTTNEIYPYRTSRAYQRTLPPMEAMLSTRSRKSTNCHGNLSRSIKKQIHQ